MTAEYLTEAHLRAKPVRAMLRRPWPRVLGLILAGCVLTSSTVRGQTLEESLRAVIDRHASDDGFAGSVVVAMHGRTVLEGGWGTADRTWDIPNTTETRYRLGSMTKAFTATVVMNLVKEGRLGFDDTIAEYITGLPPQTGHSLTIRDLLTHTSGLPVFYRIQDFERIWLYEAPRPEDLVRTVARHPLEFEPGERYAYRNIGYIALGVIVQAATGRPFEHELRRIVLEPAGLDDTGLETDGRIVPNLAQGYSRTGDAWQNGDDLDPDLLFSAGAMYATARDASDFALALLDGRILPTSLVREMWTPRIRESVDPDDVRAYGFGWHVDRVWLPGVSSSIRIVEHGGDVTSFESLLTIIPDFDAVIVLLHNHGEMAQDVIRDELISILAQHESEHGKP